MPTRPINKLEFDLSYHLCPICARSVPARAGERHCPNDGARLLEACPKCNTKISNPYAQHCTNCGHGFARGSRASAPES